MNHGEAMAALNTRVRYHDGSTPETVGVLFMVSYPSAASTSYYGNVRCDDGAVRSFSVKCLEREEKP